VTSSESCEAGTVEINFHAPALDETSMLKFVKPVELASAFQKMVAPVEV
jgi:hypothetical protein